MKLPGIVIMPLLMLGIAAGVGSPQTAANAKEQPTALPVNPNSTPEARELLRKIDQISGHATLTGQHNFPNHVSRWSDRVYDLTGKFPAIFGQDFGFSGGEDKDSTEGRPSMVEEAIRQYRNGAVIALTWHAVRPTDDEPVTFRDSVQGHLTDFEWSELLTPGTDIYNRWIEQVDVIAGYLQQLQVAGVPVLFRPYHEMNGNWFWWGGSAGHERISGAVPAALRPVCERASFEQPCLGVERKQPGWQCRTDRRILSRREVCRHCHDGYLREI